MFRFTKEILKLSEVKQKIITDMYSRYFTHLLILSTTDDDSVNQS